jgi:diacylglycerol kinase
MSKVRSVPQSFRFAFDGIKEAMKNEPNFRIHLIIGSVAIAAAVLLGLPATEWLLLSFTIAFVLILELFNTSLEAIVDLVSPEIRPKAKVAKDVAAAAVLLAATLSVILAAALFAPRIVDLYLQ